MKLNLGRIGPWLSDRLVVENGQENSLSLRVANSLGEWGSRIVSWISAPSAYTEENRTAVALFQKMFSTSLGEARLRRIEQRYGIDFDQMQEAGSPLLTRQVAKILTGAQVVNVEDMEELIQIARAEIGAWPLGIDLELRDVLREVENSESLDQETFYRVYSALKNPVASEVEVPEFNRPLHGGMPSENISCLYFDQFLADRERLALCENTPGEDFETFVHDFSARIIHREMDVGMLIPAPGDHLFYRVAAKIVSGEGLVSYCLVPATLDTDLVPVRFYRGTSARPCSIDAMSTIITDLESDLGERAFRSGEEYDQILEAEFPPFEVQAGHSLGSTILQKKLVEDRSIRTAYLFNGPGVTEKEVVRFNERIGGDPDPVQLIIRDSASDTVSLAGQRHLGFGAPEGVVDYLKYGPSAETRNAAAGYLHTMVWADEVKNYGIEGGQPDLMLNRENAEGSSEYLRSTIGPALAKILLILRDFFRWIFGSRAEEQKGLQIGRFIDGRWEVNHFRPQ